MINIILCGGTGMRLWPISRRYFPKQFNKIFDGESLFQKTVKRNAGICGGRIIVTSEDLYFIAMDQVREIEAQGLTTEGQIVLLEPAGKNTAPAIALACMEIPRDEFVLVSPSDHIIRNADEYREIMRRAATTALDGYLVTFGITPRYPETGYGYIEVDDGGKRLPGGALAVKSFCEKPDQLRASEYVESGRCYWNSGMFVFKAGDFLDELRTCSPGIYESMLAIHGTALWEGQVARFDRGLMEEISGDSIDCAVMEKSARLAVIPAEFGWNDLGDFDSLSEVLPRDGRDNTVSSKAFVINGRNNMILENARTIALMDVDDLVVVDTDDALLIGKRGSTQNVEGLLAEIERAGGSSEVADFHTKVFRPWGMFTVLKKYPNSCIKKIVVHPGMRLSLQRHKHRSEHWVVVSGEAWVTVGTDERAVRVDESAFIPRGELHRLENRGSSDIAIIEVQVGSILDENDIERVEDDFGRAG